VIATFSNLSVNLPGTYTLRVSSSGFQSLITGEFAVVPIPVTQRFTLNGAGLSAQNILLQQLRNAKSVTQTPPTQSDIDLVLENDNQPVPEADAAAAVTVAPAATTGGKFSAVSSSPSDSSIDSQLLDTTSSSNDKVILN
jgi:hypothetical protein